MKFKKGRRVVLTSGIIFSFLVAGFYFILALWFFPRIDHYTPRLEKLLSNTMGATVTIEHTSARWHGALPQFSFNQLTIAGKTKLSFARVDAGLAWWRLPQARFAYLALTGTELSLWRDANHQWYLAGAPLNEGGSSHFIRWLFQQGGVSFQKTTFFFEDKTGELPALILKSDDFFWQKKRHGLAFSGHFEPDPAFSSKIGVKGLWKQKEQGPLAGEINLLVEDLQANCLENPWVKGGYGNLEARLKRDHDGFFFQFSGNLHDLNMSFTDQEPLFLSQVSGKFSWKKNAREQMVTMDHFLLALEGKPSRPISAHVLWGDEGGELKADWLDLSLLMPIAEKLPLQENPLAQRFTAAGSMEDVAAKWQGPLSSPEKYHFSAKAVDFSVAEKEGAFGVTHLFGSLHGNEEGGTLKISSAKNVNLAQIFSKPLHFEELTGIFSWGIAKERFSLALENVHMRNSDFTGSLKLHYYHRPSDNQIVLDLDLKDVLLVNVPDYLPRNSSKGLQQWLRQSLIGGRASTLELHLGGDLDRFPFSGEKPPGFVLRAQLKDAVLAYSPSWPWLSGISGQLSIENEKLSIEATEARMEHLVWHNLEATIANYDAPDKILLVQGEATGDGSTFMHTLFETPLREKLAALQELTLDGPGNLKLALHVDLDSPEDTKSQGEYHFQQTTIAYGKAAKMEKASGTLDFSDNRFDAPNIEGLMFGSQTRCALKTLDSGDIQLGCEGTALAENLKEEIWADLPASGQSAWSGTLVAGNGKTSLHIESSLEGLLISLPEPFYKENTAKVDFHLDLDFRKQATQWRFRYAKNNIIDGEWWSNPDAPGFKITRGIVRINDKTPAPSSGFWINGNLDRFVVDNWLDYLDGGSESGFKPTRIHLDTGELEIFDRVFDRTAIEVTTSDGLWRVHFHGNDLLGELSFRKNELQANLARLEIAPKLPGWKASSFPKRQQTSIPNLNIHVADLVFEGKTIGAVDLIAKPNKENIAIETFQVTVPEGFLTAKGVWKNWRTNPSTEWQIEVETSNLGNLLQRYGLDGQVIGGEGKLKGTIYSPEPPYAVNFTEAQGDFAFEFRKGRLVQLNTGIFGRLLGLMRVEALPRRFMLDFSDIFEKGFSFDLLEGESKLGNHQLTFNNMVIAGPPGGFVLTGHVDLGQKRQDLTVRFVPATLLGDGLAIGAGILGGPAAGFGAFILQKALGDPLGQLITLEYKVGGTWSDPKIQPLAKAAGPKGGG